MRVALFTEGPSDSAVIGNILKGCLNIDRSDIQFITPELFSDETDLNAVNKFSGWTVVKKECIEREKIKTFFDDFDDDDRFAVIQLDSAERNDIGYDCRNTVKSNADFKKYSSDLRREVILKINDWLDNNYIEKIAYAIAIEEIDAWVLTIPSSISDTSKINNPKKKLEESWELIVSKKEAIRLRSYGYFERYSSLSLAFRKERDLHKYKLKNKSLSDLCDDLLRFK